MEIIKIDRLAHFHGDYKGIICITYDEAVMIASAIYRMADSEEYSALYDKWNDFRDILCYGKITKNRREDNVVLHC